MYLSYPGNSEVKGIMPVFESGALNRVFESYSENQYFPVKFNSSQQMV